MPLLYRNQAAIRSKNPEVAQALDDLAFYLENISNQANVDPHGSTVSPPPTINSLKVTAAQGVHEISINDNSAPVIRGINYYVEHSTSPQFSAPHVLDLGSSRNHRVFLGNQTRFFRAYSAYPNSARSAPVYHGTETNPIPVIGGGTRRIRVG